MGIFNNDLEIDVENPFKNDKLQRELEMESLTSIFSVIGNQMVLAVNSQWGTGKTSFLKMWNQYLINEKYKAIFFNAWENDYVEEPFIAFVEEIRKSINDEDKIRGFIDKAKEVGFALAKQSPKMVSKIIKEKTGFDSQEIISEDKLIQMVADKIDIYNKTKSSVVKFREELQEIANKQFIESNKPIVIFVDELDRCRPDYAISLLERIKHFFNVQNIIFILGIDKEALSNSIRVIYGEQTDVNGYLTRFIDLEYKLKESNRKMYAKYLLDKYKFEDLFVIRKSFNCSVNAERNIEDFTNVIVNVMIGFRLSLRDIEKLLVEIYMIIKANIKKYIFPYQLILMLVIKHINKELYSRIKSNQVQYVEFIKMLKEYNLETAKWIDTYDASIFKAFLIWLLNDMDEVSKLKRNVESFDEKNRYENEDVRCLELYDWIINDKGYYLHTSHDYKTIKENIYRMAELYDNFTTINDN